MAKISPTARSMKHLREAGYIVAKVEQRLPIPGQFVTRDAFNVGDLLVARPPNEITLVQVTSTANLSAREKKARLSEELAIWLASGGRFVLHGWGRKRVKGTSRKTWQLTERTI